MCNCLFRCFGLHGDGSCQRYVEIQSGRIAVAKGSFDVANLGQMIIDDHTRTTASLKAAAVSVGSIQPIPILNALQSQTISELQLASNLSFDQLFCTVITLLTVMCQRLAVAASAVPIVQSHIDRVTILMPALTARTLNYAPRSTFNFYFAIHSHSLYACDQKCLHYTRLARTLNTLLTKVDCL